MGAPSRRELLALLLGAPYAVSLGCRTPPRLPPAGEIVGGSVALGHRLREEPSPAVPEERWRNVGVVIVGGGIAGLSAARELLRRGVEDFVVLELEPAVGGTSRGGTTAGFAHPWGAHYVPVPNPTNTALIELLEEMAVIEGRAADGRPLVGEQYLCREPEERLFIDGQWREGLNPLENASPEEWGQWQRVQDEFRRWYAWRDGRGRPAFALPTTLASDDADVTALDRLSFAQWLDQLEVHSPRVRWMMEYACRDDYGATLECTSAWAGLFYFVSRMTDERGGHQPLITWPEGNGRVVRHLAQRIGARVEVACTVREIVPRREGERPGCDVIALAQRGAVPCGYHARRVIFAAPQFLAPHVIRGYQDDRVKAARQFEYGSWLVANLTLSQRPREEHFPLAWDNVLYDSPSLGYVTATHQRGIDHGATVLTYYFPFCDADAGAARHRLLDLSWEDCAELILADLDRAHPDLRSLVDRLDVMRWGHAMVRPRPGFVWSPELRGASQPSGAIHFAHTDLSGMALLEEALAHGQRAAEEVAAALDV